MKYGAIGLNDIDETITRSTVWFVKRMMEGKRNNEAKVLFHDTLENIIHSNRRMYFNPTTDWN